MGCVCLRMLCRRALTVAVWACASRKALRARTPPARERRQGVRFSRAHGLSRRNAAKKGIPIYGYAFFGAAGRTRTDTVSLPLDFESSASANFTTAA